MILPRHLRARVFDLEILDRERVSPATMERVVRFLRFINRFLGGVGPICSHLGHGPEPITVLDVACGAGDVLRMVVARRPHVRPIALDHGADILAFARELPRMRGDAFRLPFRDRSVDWVITTLFFHHLTDDQVVAALREFDRVARRGIVVNDLLRRWRAWFWASVLGLFTDPVVRFDGPLSVRRAYREDEILALARRAGLDWLRVRTHFGHRFTLAGERPR